MHIQISRLKKEKFSPDSSKSDKLMVRCSKKNSSKINLYVSRKFKTS